MENPDTLRNLLWNGITVKTEETVYLRKDATPDSGFDWLLSDFTLENEAYSLYSKFMSYDDLRAAGVDFSVAPSQN